MTGGHAHDIALLISDVDGTLVDENKVLTERARRAVHALHKAGIAFAVTSGRPPRGMAMLVEPLSLDQPIAAFNGGVYVRPADLTVISEHPLKPSAARRALDTLDHGGLDTWLYTGRDWLVRNQDAPHVEREAWTVKFSPRVVPDFTDALLADAVKIVGVSDDHEAVAQCEKQAQARLGDQASASRSQPYYLDVTSPQANKGEVVTAFARRLNIPTSRIACIGDGPNDVLMFRRCGFSIAMGNAHAEVKQAASAVTARHDEDGFAEAVERFLLGARR